MTLPPKSPPWHSPHGATIVASRLPLAIASASVVTAIRGTDTLYVRRIRRSESA
jgi:hypothetical protein